MSSTTAGRVKDPGDTYGRLIAASKVNSTAVYDRQGNRLGSVEDIMIDKTAGQVDYAILSFGGFLGIGSDYYPLPWRQLNYDTSLGGFRVDLTKERLEGAPRYTRDSSWSDWNSVDTYYGNGI